MAFIMWASNQKFALEGKILKPHLQGLRAEANTLVKWSFIPVWEAYSISLEQLSWAKVFENVNKDRRKYCRSVYYGKSLFKYTALLFLKCREGALPSQRPAGSKWGRGGAGGERLGQVARSHSGAPGRGWSLAGLTLDPAHSSLRIWGPPVRPHACPGDPRNDEHPVRWEENGTVMIMTWRDAGHAKRGPGSHGGTEGEAAVPWASERLSAPSRRLAHQDPHPLPAPWPLPHSFWHDTWQANSRKAKVTHSRSCWVKAALWQDGKTSESQVPTSEWLEWNRSWMEREGRQGYPGARPRSQMLPGRATEGFCSHHDMCYSTDTWVPRQLWLGAHLQFHNLPKFLPLFVKKRKKKMRLGGEQRGHFSLSRRLGDSWHYQLWLRVSHNSDRRLKSPWSQFPWLEWEQLLRGWLEVRYK